MSQRLRVLLVEDSDDDAALSLRELRRGGFEVEHVRVQSSVELREALVREDWDVVVCDYSLPSFGAIEAIAIIKESGLDLPILIVSGTIGEETAVDALKMGAHDFLVKGRLARLVPAIRRELRDVGTRRERRRAEDQLRASEERFRTLVESIDDVVFLLDREERYEGVFGRRAGEGHDRAARLGKTVRDLFEADVAAVHEAANQRALAGEQVVYEWSTSTPGRPTRSFQTSVSPHVGSSGEIVGLVGVERETTEQKRADSQLLLSDRLASVGMLAAGVAHEINNPLAAVMGNLELASAAVEALLEQERGSTELTEVSEELGDALEAARRIATIVRDIKLFSRGDSERRQPVDVRAVLDSSIRMAWNEIRHRARIVRAYAEVPPIEATESRLGQVFLNLIVNAAQAIPEGRAGGNVIRVAVDHAEERVCVAIQDTGTGMPPHVIRQLFTPFFTTKAVGVGTGLGLSICHRIITSIGGEIEVESEEGVGSTFRVILPLGPANAVPLEQPAPKKRSSAPPRAERATVLVVDDDAGVCEVVRRLIEDRFQVVTTTSGTEALGWIRGGARYDVVLCDLMMPELPGVGLYQALRDVAPDQLERLVFMTGGVFSPQARAFIEETRVMLLEKPFDRHAIYRAIEQCMG